jgi:hypothetical protein
MNPEATGSLPPPSPPLFSCTTAASLAQAPAAPTQRRRWLHRGSPPTSPPSLLFFSSFYYTACLRHPARGSPWTSNGWLSSPMLRPTRLLHFDHPDGPSLAKLARSRTQPAQHSHSGPGLVRPVHAPTRGPRPYGPGPLQTQRALLPCCHSRPGARLPKSLPACSLYALGSLALHLSQPFCTLLLGFIGLALSRPGYHPLRRVHWRPASPSAYLARVLRSQPEPARITFSASGTRCNPLHRPARLQVGSSAHGSHLSRPAPSSPRRVHGVIPYTGPLAFKWVHRLTAST